MSTSPTKTNSSRWPDLGQFWTAANMLTLMRLLLIGPIVYLIWIEASGWWLVGLVGVAIISDGLDGWIARKTNTVSEWGKILDPLADKVAAIAITLTLLLQGRLPLWFVTLVVGRDVLIMGASAWFARKKGMVAMSLQVGKVTVAAVAMTVVVILLNAEPRVVDVCLWGASVLIGYSVLVYTVTGITFWRKGARSQQAYALDGLSDELTGVLYMLLIHFIYEGTILAEWLIWIVVIRGFCILVAGLWMTRVMGEIVRIWTDSISARTLAALTIAVFLQTDADVLYIFQVATAILLVYSFLLYGQRAIQIIRAYRQRKTDRAL